MPTHRLTRVIVSVLVAGALVAPFSAATADAAESRPTSVIVQKLPGAGDAPEEFVKSLGGKVLYDLSIIDGFAASVDESQLKLLRNADGVAFVTSDDPVRMAEVADTRSSLLGGLSDALRGVADDALDSTTSTLLPSGDKPLVKESTPEKTEGPGTPPETPTATAPEAPAADDAHTSVYNDAINATDVHADGVTGEGVTVALIDTGVANIPDLDDRIVDVKAPNGTTKRCVDISGERNCDDTYGHGTFIAGLIAGTGDNSNGDYKGVAPGAKILSVKISGKDGSSSVGKIIYAIQWVTRYGDDYGVKVMNLSLGTDSRQSYKVDPLNYAVERAWKSGISVVVSAGNNGAVAGSVAKPADDPFVITTGAVDDKATADISDDVVPDFSSRGPTAADGIVKPDLTAPGTRIISTRSPGSTIEQEHPGGGVDATYRRGSGTSQAAGIVSGSVALLLQAHPKLTPDEVKYALVNSAQDVPASSDPNAVGAGIVDIGAAVANPPQGKANQGIQASTGRGSLENSQGSVRVAVKDGANLLGVLSGVIPIKKEDSSDPSGLAWYPTSWLSSGWYSGGWYSGGWYSGGWYSSGWYSGGWYSGGWYSGGWYSGGWYSGGWYSGGWYSTGWYGFWD
jgi:serine protease AprX